MAEMDFTDASFYEKPEELEQPVAGGHDAVLSGGGRAEPQAEACTAPQKPDPSTFQAHKGQRRKPGTGCVSQINDHLWEGRYSPIWPDGKKHARNIYAHSEAECEALLAEMIVEMKAEIAAEKERIKAAPKAS